MYFHTICCTICAKTFQFNFACKSKISPTSLTIHRSVVHRLFIQMEKNLLWCNVSYLSILRIANITSIKCTLSPFSNKMQKILYIIILYSMINICQNTVKCGTFHPSLKAIYVTRFWKRDLLSINSLITHIWRFLQPFHLAGPFSRFASHTQSLSCLFALPSWSHEPHVFFMLRNEWRVWLRISLSLQQQLTLQVLVVRSSGYVVGPSQEFRGVYPQGRVAGHQSWTRVISTCWFHASSTNALSSKKAVSFFANRNLRWRTS